MLRPAVPKPVMAVASRVRDWRDRRLSDPRHSDRVAAILVQSPVRLVRQRDGAEIRPTLQLKLLIERDLLRVNNHRLRPSPEDRVSSLPSGAPDRRPL